MVRAHRQPTVRARTSSKAAGIPDCLADTARLFGEVGEGQDFGFGGVHHLAGFGEQAGEVVRDLVPGVVNGSDVGLGEDGPQRGGGHLLVGSGHARQQA